MEDPLKNWGINDPEKYKEIMATIADEVEELVTNPEFKNAGFDIEAGEKIRKGEKIEPARMINDRVIRVCQDFRLPPEQTDIIKTKIFESK